MFWFIHLLWVDTPTRIKCLPSNGQSSGGNVPGPFLHSWEKYLLHRVPLQWNDLHVLVAQWPVQYIAHRAPPPCPIYYERFKCQGLALTLYNVFLAHNLTISKLLWEGRGQDIRGFAVDCLPIMTGGMLDVHHQQVTGICWLLSRVFHVGIF